MTTTINPNVNGRKRPSLSDQINRLDQTLDGLADGLNEAVADAVKDAVRGAVCEAVQGVLTDVLTNPAVIARLHAAMTPEASGSSATLAQSAREPISLRQRLDTVCAHARASIACLRAACGQGMRKARVSLRNGWRRTIEYLKSLAPHWEMLRRFRFQIFTALGIGVLVGVCVWQAGPELGVVVSSIGAFSTSMTVQVGLWLRKMFARATEQLA